MLSHAQLGDETIIRRVEPGDLAALLEIYNHFVRETPATFDIEPRTLAQRKIWLDGFAASGRYQCFVAARNCNAVGFASSQCYKERSAYDTTIQSSIYLFGALAGEDIHRIFGGITLPNEASVRLHRSFGFEPVGTYREVGRKFGRYWDVATYLKPWPVKSGA